MSPRGRISDQLGINVKIEEKLTERSRTDLLSKAVLASDAEVNSVCGGGAAVGHLVLSEMGTVSFKRQRRDEAGGKQDYSKRGATPRGHQEVQFLDGPMLANHRNDVARHSHNQRRSYPNTGAALGWQDCLPIAQLAPSRMLVIMANDIKIIILALVGPSDSVRFGPNMGG